MGVGRSVKRLDALEKVTGTAAYVEDLLPQNALVAKILHSTIANGVVTSMDVTAARALPGVALVLTCFDVPQNTYPTVAHPISLEPEHAEIEDHLMLASRVRYYGEDIAVVVAADALTAQKALSLITVVYEEAPPVLTCQDAWHSTGLPIHPEYPAHNCMAELCYEVTGNRLITTDGAHVRRKNEALSAGGAACGGPYLDNTYTLPMVQHAHIENISSFAYKEGKRTVIVSATQAPHILRESVAQATGLPLGDIRIIKPFIGGGFGNKQEVLYEPLLALLTNCLGGRCVGLILTREETFINSRVRHAMDIRVRSALSGGETPHFTHSVAIHSNKGAYASHGHAVPAHAITNVANIYTADVTLGESYSIFTNLPASAAMRGYGTPQVAFAVESQMDELAQELGVDPIALRERYMMKPGFVDPFDPVERKSDGLQACVQKGAELFDWARKRREFAQDNTGDVRRGVGMAIFCYKSCVQPILLETASCRIILNQNGSLQIQVGATEIGQGSDTALAQLASEVLCIPEEKIHLTSTQDTDTTPYDPGSYASRQTYVSGGAVKQAALALKEKVLAHAAVMSGCPADELDIENEAVVHRDSRLPVLTIGQVASHALYNKQNSQQLVAEETYNCRSNAFALGACFAEVEVDIPLGRLRVVRILNVHDSGRIINPQLARGQVHGGVAMGVGYALGEQMLFDPKTGRPLNNNLLDYKIPTAMDVPPIETVFVETLDPTGPFGNKALGEPPLIPVAPAIRNALYHATGVAVHALPMTPQKLVERFVACGLLDALDAAESQGG